MSDPGICTEQQSSSAKAGEHGHQLEQPPRPRRPRARPAPDPVEADVGRWKGKKPPPRNSWTRQRCVAIRARSKFQTNKSEMPAVYDCVLGPRLRELAHAGRAYPYPLEHRRRRKLDLPPTRPGMAWKLRDTHLRALGWVIAAHLAMRTKGLIISHETMGELLGLKKRRTGDIMRDLCDWGLLASRPWFSEDGRLGWQLSSLYTVTAHAILFFDVRPRRARKLPADDQASTGVPARKILPSGKDLENEGAVARSATGLSADPVAVPAPDGSIVPTETQRTRPVALRAETEAARMRPPSAIRRAEERIAAAATAAAEPLQVAIAAKDRRIGKLELELAVREQRDVEGRVAAVAENAAAAIAPASKEQPPPVDTTLDEYRRRLERERAELEVMRQNRPVKPANKPSDDDEVDAAIAKARHTWAERRAIRRDDDGGDS